MHFIRKSIHKLFTRRVTRTPEREGRTTSIAETRANCLRFQGKREHLRRSLVPTRGVGTRGHSAISRSVWRPVAHVYAHLQD